MNTDNETTLDDVLEAITTSSQAVENRLEKIEGDIKDIKNDIKDIRATAVTETVLDKKFLKYGDRMTEIAKDGDTKLAAVVDTLYNKKILTNDEKKKIFSLKPFPQLAL